MKSQWTYHLILVLITFIVISIAVVSRGRQAVAGILWNSNTIYCSLIGENCAIDLEGSDIKLGMYDPHGVFNDSSQIGVDHYFIDWNDSDLTSLKFDLDISTTRNRWAMVSVEPWSNKELDKETLLSDVNKGLYNSQINNVCNILKLHDKPAFVRWGHEMENVTGRYPWAIEDSAQYISAYQHFVDRCKAIYSKGYYVWSPAGNKNLTNYWPGGKYIDYVGLSVYAFDQYDLKNYSHKRSFQEIVSEKYDYVDKFEKPIMIAELGVNGDSEYQKKWIGEGLTTVGQFPKIKNIIYFNSKDNALAWSKDYAIPQWNIDRKIFSK
ncbi:MAG: hypothetical protein M3P33_03450 [bacterium]|nr:hypothetical protein [bacterium]